jgi:hypothetical protein
MGGLFPTRQAQYCRPGKIRTTRKAASENLDRMRLNDTIDVRNLAAAKRWQEEHFVPNLCLKMSLVAI